MDEAVFPHKALLEVSIKVHIKVPIEVPIFGLLGLMFFPCLPTVSQRILRIHSASCGVRRRAAA